MTQEQVGVSRRAMGQMMLGGLLAGPALAAQAPDYSAEDFARRPLLEGVTLSPDGKRLAAIVNRGNLSVLVTRPSEGGEFMQVLAGDNLDFQFTDFRWVSNERLVVRLRMAGERQVGMASWAAVMETRLIAVNPDGSKTLNLVRSNASQGSTRFANSQDEVVDWLPDDGEHLLLALPATDFNPARAVYKVNVNTGRRTLYHDSRGNIHRWLTDRTHRVRLGLEADAGRLAWWACDAEGKTWRRLASFGILDAAEIEPLGFGLDPNQLYVLAQHGGLRAVHRMDLREAEPRLQLVLADPRVDLGGSLIHDPRSGEAVGISASRESGSSAYFWDPGYQRLIAAVDQALPGRRNELLQQLADGSTYLMRSSGNAIPGEYLLGRRAQGALAVLAECHPQLDPARLAPQQALTLRARDGLALPCLLTLPRDRPPRRLPLVLLPHGGPQAHDSIGYHPWVAFLADRGYAVLQVNFRGSTGYGQAFMELGLKRWGLEMQDDLSDAVLGLVARGIADRERLAVAGASYGGYAALMAGVRTPELFKGLFAFAPVTDLVELAREAERPWRQWQGHRLRRQLGDLEHDRDRLVATSPARQAARIQSPVLLIHGTLDRQAEHEHSVWMAEALQKAGKPCRFISQPRGDHQLSHQAHRNQLFSELEAFLRQTIGPGAPPA